MILVFQIVYMLHSLPLPPVPSISILIRTGYQRRPNSTLGELRKKKAVGLHLYRAMFILQFIKDDDFLGPRTQTEGSLFLFGVVKKGAPEDLSKFIDATFTKQK